METSYKYLEVSLLDIKTFTFALFSVSFIKMCSRSVKVRFKLAFYSKIVMLTRRIKFRIIYDLTEGKIIFGNVNVNISKLSHKIMSKDNEKEQRLE